MNWLGIGIEIGSEIVKGESIKGGFSLTKIKNVINSTRDSGISVGSNFIVGLPEDTIETCNETADLAIELATEYINIYPCIDLPGSDLHVKSTRIPTSNYLRYGFLSYETIPNSTREMDATQVLRIRDELWEKIYSSPSVENTILNRFGTDSLANIRSLRKIKMRRRLIDEGKH